MRLVTSASSVPPRALRAPAFGAVDQALLSAGNLGFTVLLARWLEADGYGAFTLAFALILLLGGIYNSVVIEPACIFGATAARGADRAVSYLGTALRIHVIATAPVIGLVPVVLAGALVTGWHRDGYWPTIVIGAALVTPFLMLFWLLRRWAYVVHAPVRAIVITVVHVVVLIGGVVATRRLEALSLVTGLGVLAGAGLVAAAVGLLADPAARRAFGGKRQTVPSAAGPSAIGAHLAYGRWAVLASFVHWGAGNLYYYLTGMFAGLGEVAALRAVSVCLQPVRTIEAGVTNVLLPELAAVRRADGSGRTFRRRVAATAAVFGAVAATYGFCVTALAEPLLSLLFQGRYDHAARYVPLLALAVVVEAVADGPIVGLKAVGQTRAVFLAFGAAAAVTLLVGTVSVARWGTMGAAATSVGSAVALLAAVWVLFRAQMDAMWTTPSPRVVEAETRV